MVKNLLIILFLSIITSGAYAQETNGYDILSLKMTARVKNPEFQQSLKKRGHNSNTDWQALIDVRWGTGLSTNEKLQIFDRFWKRIDENFAGFPNSNVDWSALRDRYRKEVESGVSRGRFNAILNHMALALHERHTFAFENAIHSDVLEPGVPLMVGSPTYAYNHFGAALTPLQDSSLLVYSVLPNHPLGLELGDRVLGFDGKPWKILYQELLSYELPVTWLFFGSTKESDEHTWLTAAGENWHLFDIIDIIKYGSADTSHLPTSLLLGKNLTLPITEQLPVPGVPFPDIPNNQAISWGIIEGSTIGYIYTYAWLPQFNSAKFQTAVLDLMYNHKTTGLIIDTRFNVGGQPGFYTEGLKHLFNEDIYILDAVRRSDINNHLGFSPALSSWPISYNYLGFAATEDIYDKPIAILTGPASYSSGDLFPYTLKQHPYARSFGMPTNGAFSGYDASVSDYSLAPGWSMFYANHTFFPVGQADNLLVHTAPEVDEEIWLEQDDVAKGEDTVVKRAIEWIQDLAYAHDITISKTYAKPGVDDIIVSARVENPNQHNITVYTFIKNESSITDSVSLFDDGLHYDAEAKDGIWGNTWQTSESEDNYKIDIRTDDLNANDVRTLSQVKRFTTIGPLKYKGFEVVTVDDQTIDPGETHRFKFNLENQGESVTAKSITARITALDTFATVISPLILLNFGDINAGQTMLCNNYRPVKFSSHFQGPIDTVRFALEIASDGVFYWRDSTVQVVVGLPEQTQNIPLIYALKQNYPNPFNPSTTIEFTLPRPEYTTLKIYNILGAELGMLISERLPAGLHRIAFDGSRLASGVYYYQVTAGSFRDVKKMVLLR